MTQGRKEYLTTLTEMMHELEAKLPRQSIDRRTPINEWCPCRAQVKAAVRAMETVQANACSDLQISDKAWRSIRLTLAGCLPACKGLYGMSSKVRSVMERKIIDHVIDMQHVVVIHLGITNSADAGAINQH